MFPTWLIQPVLRLMWRLVVLAAALAWRLPGLVLSAAPSLVRAITRAVRRPFHELAAAEDTATCPRCGQTVLLLGRWVCPICRSVETTHAWAPCRACGTEIPAGYVACEEEGCGEAIPNPKLRGVA